MNRRPQNTGTPTQEPTRAEFSPAWLRQQMPRSKKRSQVQVLKKFKNKCMQVMEEAAKNDRYNCTVSFQPLELGFSLQYELDEVSERICRWLRRKGFSAEPDEDNALRINISWMPEEAPKPLVPAPLTPNVLAQAPLAQLPTYYYSQPQQPHPWFSWMGQQAPEPVALPQTPRTKRAK